MNSMIDPHFYKHLVLYIRMPLPVMAGMANYHASTITLYDPKLSCDLDYIVSEIERIQGRGGINAPP